MTNTCHNTLYFNNMLKYLLLILIFGNTFSFPILEDCLDKSTKHKCLKDCRCRWCFATEECLDAKENAHKYKLCANHTSRSQCKNRASLDDVAYGFVGLSIIILFIIFGLLCAGIIMKLYEKIRGRPKEYPSLLDYAL